MARGVYQRTEAHNKKIGDANRGKEKTPEQRLKMSLARKGKPAHNRGVRNPKISGEKHWNWKGGIYFNPVYVSQSKNRRHTLLLENGGNHTNDEWEKLKAQYNWTCPNCKKSEPEIILNKDHIIPASKGGSDNIENIQPLCKKCNAQKFTQIIKY